jgi:microsomal epoxide hydrolase
MTRRDLLQAGAALGTVAAGTAAAAGEAAVRPYRIAVPDAALADLKDRLARTRWPARIPGAGWGYGADVAYLQDLCGYWGSRYDWRAQEAQLNAAPQFVTDIDGVAIHFWHVKGRGPRPMPLLLLHGWPGSNLEFFDLLGPLSDPAAHGGAAEDAFDLVVPAIPGFGFSGKPQEQGWGFTRIASVMDRLMTERLGYPRYAIQGGDVGTLLGGRMARNHAGHIAGLHINMPYAPPPPGVQPPPGAQLSPRELGYMQIQNTKPDALTVAQSDSPAGLATWIVEKFRAWSDCDGEVERAVSRDDLLTNVMFYWLNNSAASAARIYYENANEPPVERPRSPVPTAIAAFPREPFRCPRDWVEPRHNIVRWTEMPKGGHFAALEQPDLLARDMREFFRDYRA